MFRTFGGGLRLGVALVDVRLDVVRLPPRSSSPTVAGCRLGGDPVGHDRWGGERVVGGVLPSIGIGDGVCVTVYVSFFSAGAGTVWGVWFFSSFWDRVWAE